MNLFRIKILIFSLIMMPSTTQASSEGLVASHGHNHLPLLDKLAEIMMKNIEQIADGSVLSFGIVTGLAFLFGVFHALGPGHGKLIVISYFILEKAKYVRGAILGFKIAFFHALSSIAIVVLTREFIHLTISPEDEIRAIKLVSYAIIILLGFFMLYRHKNGCTCTCCACKDASLGGDRRMEWLLAFSIGIIPCPGILVFLFYTLSNNMLGTGIMLVLVMALGIGLTLLTIGIGSIFIRKKALDNISDKNVSTFAKISRIVASMIIIILGLFLFIVNF